MKRAFTIVELIFVIVVLGILAAVVIPRLTVTRDDAETSVVSSNIATFIGDLRSYYTANGNFESDLNKMTNVRLFSGGNGLSDSFSAGGKKCINVTLNPTYSDGKPYFIKFEAESNPASICLSVMEHRVVKAVLNNKFQYIKKSAESVEWSDAGEVSMADIAIKF